MKRLWLGVLFSLTVVAGCSGEDEAVEVEAPPRPVAPVVAATPVPAPTVAPTPLAATPTDTATGSTSSNSSRTEETGSNQATSEPEPIIGNRSPREVVANAAAKIRAATSEEELRRLESGYASLQYDFIEARNKVVVQETYRVADQMAEMMRLLASACDKKRSGQREREWELDLTFADAVAKTI